MSEEVNDLGSGFHPVETKRASEMIYDQIRDQIISRELSPGDRLPGEKELMQLFRRSRPTIREALRMLEQNGFIRTIPGSGGAVVQEIDPARIEQLISDALQGALISLPEMAELRALCETAFAGWAAERRTQEELAELQGILEKMRDPDLDGSEFIALDPVFHRALAAAAHNKAAAIMNKVMAEINRSFLDKKVADMTEGARKKMRKRICDQHEAVLKAVEAQDAEGARLAMEAHMRGFQTDLDPTTEFV